MPAPAKQLPAYPVCERRGAKRIRRSPKRLYPLFLAVASATRYASACAAVYKLSRELLKIGQSPSLIIKDLTLTNSAADTQLGLLLIAEIVHVAAHGKEGKKGRIGSRDPRTLRPIKTNDSIVRDPVRE